MQTKVIDNWLEPHLVQFLDGNLTFERPHWFGHRSVEDDTPKKGGFYNHTLDPQEALNKYLFYKLVKTLNMDLGLIRMYFNVQWKGMNGSFHDDDGDLTCLYMVTKTLPGEEGCLEIKGEEKYQFVQNRLIVFEAKKLHKGLAPKKGPRITLAFKTKRTA